MKKQVRILTIALFSIAGLVASAQATKEKTVHNPSWTWVTVKNPDGIKNGNGFHDFNESCGIAEGGTLEVVKTMGDKVLVKYASPKSQGYGSECRNGTIFWMASEKYGRAEADYRKIIAARDAEKDEIWRILRFGNHAPPPKNKK